MRNAINLRVYRRTFDHLIVLWNTKGLAPDQKEVNIYVQEKDKWRPIEFVLAAAVEELLGEKVPIPDQTAMAGIVHEKNSLDPGQDCKLKIVLGKDKPLETFMQVFKVGVLPSTEKDRKEAHSQLLGWSEDGQVWAKVPLRKTKHGWALPVVLIKED